MTWRLLLLALVLGTLASMAFGAYAGQVVFYAVLAVLLTVWALGGLLGIHARTHHHEV